MIRPLRDGEKEHMCVVGSVILWGKDKTEGQWEYHCYVWTVE